MTISQTRAIEDIQKCIHGVINSLTGSTAPWTSWVVVLGWPESDVFEKYDKPFIYVLEPFLVDTTWFQGSKTLGMWEMIVGAWDDRKTGGTEEINIICSRLLDLFNNPQLANTTAFNVTLGGTAISNTTLKAQGVKVTNVVGPRDIATENLKEFRKELTITLIA